MGRKKKPFIDKKSAQTFRLVHRSQKDPLQADEESAQHVFIPVDAQKHSEEGGGASATNAKELVLDPDETRSQQKDYEIFFDDEYDYMQHLKRKGEEGFVPAAAEMVKKKRGKKTVRLELPKEVLPSEREEEVGLLNKAAPIIGPQPDWDPDIVAALDDAPGTEEELDDDFILKAGGPLELESDDEEGSTSSDPEWEGSEDGKSRFTEYSMTSSVLRRNEGLTGLDHRFERLMEEYDDDEIGALDTEDIEGMKSSQNVVVAQALDEFLEQEEKAKMETLRLGGHHVRKTECDSDSEDEEMVHVEVPCSDEKWDCESVLSTYSNLYNHPTKIKEPSSLHAPHQRKDKEGCLEADAESLSLTALPERRKGESKEERKARKQAVKEDRQSRRAAKKATKTAFKHEQKAMEKSLVTNQFRRSTVKII